MTSITLGVAGLSLVIESDLDPLVPQPLVAVTDIDPEINPAGYVNDIVFPVRTPAGVVQL